MNTDLKPEGTNEDHIPNEQEQCTDVATTQGVVVIEAATLAQIAGMNEWGSP